MLRVARLAPVLVASLALIAACGSDDESTTTTAAVTTAATTEAPAATTAETTAATTADTTGDTTADTTMDTTGDTTAATMDTTADTTMDTTADTTMDTTADTTMDTTSDTTADTEAPSAGSLIDAATAAGNFTTLLAAVEAAGLTEDLATNKYTVLAPTDEAFAALGQPAIDAVLADPAQLTALLQNHLLPLDQTARSIGIFSKVVTVAGNPLVVTKDGDTVTVGGATIVQPDITADNGFLHGIDTVLVPAPAA